jgi:hypothetical protein
MTHGFNARKKYAWNLSHVDDSVDARSWFHVWEQRNGGADES